MEQSQWIGAPSTLYINKHLSSLSELQRLQKPSWPFFHSLLVIPPWIWPKENEEQCRTHLESLEYRSDFVIAQAQENQLDQMELWSPDEETLLEKLSMLCALARYDELYPCDYIKGVLGQVHLDFIDGKGNPLCEDLAIELREELGWDFGAVEEFLTDIIISFEVDLVEDLNEDYARIAQKVEEQLRPLVRWGAWIEHASDAIATFLEQSFGRKRPVAYADTAVRPPKPTQNLVIWRKNQEEISLCVFADQLYIQYFGLGAPRLFLGQQELTQSALPSSFQDVDLTWWSLPFTFSHRLELISNGRRYAISLQSPLSEL